MPAKSAVADATRSSERVLEMKRTFNAPRDLVWKVWAEVEHAKEWWGPRGFTTPVVEMDARPGGKWRAVMVGPDGKEYPQHGVFREVVPPERIAYTFIWDEHPEEETLVTVKFTERGAKTEMDFRHTGFTSVAQRDDHREGWTECFDRLDELLEKAGAPR